MFEANLNVKPIEDGFGVFTNITANILDDVNQTQYYAPGLTFILVLYVYILIGEGKIWKYLLGTTLSYFIGSILNSLYEALRLYFTLDYVLQIKWLEAIFWHLNEYGYVFISYLKLKFVVEELQKKHWEYIMKILFVYNIIIRLLIAFATIVGRKSSASSHLLGLTLFPLSLVEISFMYLIIKTSIKNSNEYPIYKGIISTMLKSSLTRMFLVGLIYFLSSLVCYAYSPPIFKGIKSVVWRMKAALGIIFLLDLIFIRIDLNEKMNSYKPMLNEYISGNSLENNNFIINTSTFGRNGTLSNKRISKNPSSISDNHFGNNSIKTLQNNDIVNKVNTSESVSLNEININSSSLTLQNENNVNKSKSRKHISISEFNNLSQTLHNENHHNFNKDNIRKRNSINKINNNTSSNTSNNLNNSNNIIESLSIDLSDVENNG